MADRDITAAGEAEAIPSPAQFAAPVRRRRRRWPQVFAALVALILVAVLILGRVNVNDYALSPGDATPVASFISVPRPLDHPLHGTILLTDVFVQQLTALTYLQKRFFSSGTAILPSAELLGPATPPDQFAAQGFLEMSQAQSFATAAALTHLGYTATSSHVGALVYGISPGSPASKVLKVSQVITGVNGTPVTTACGVVAALHGLKPGTTATLSVNQSQVKQSGAFVNGPIVPKTITLGTPPKGLTEPAACGAANRIPTVYLGIDPEDQLAWTFPVKVVVRTADIGGPSAGLSMTLGIIDKLSGGDLTGKRIVAATGTIDAQGNVGDVGGVAQKTIAVERAGATVFFVPPQEYKAARSEDTPQLHVYAVSTLDQALRILRRLGGTTPDSPVPAQAAP
jgi:PDZ domain-containing protein